MAPKRAPPPSSVPPSTASPARGQTSASSAPRSSPNTPSKPAATSSSSVTTKASQSSSNQANLRNAQDAQEILMGIWKRYERDTPARMKVLDIFMGFLMLVGVIQFVYCVIAGNYPFNAFLSGFSATVGQFVLTASLRMQTNPENKVEFQSRSHERAFADYIFGSLILHFFCVNFIN